MEELKKQFKVFFYLISLIITIIATFYFTNRNNLKEHVNLKSDHLSNDITKVDKKLAEFKQETKDNFDQTNKKLDKLDILIKQMFPKE